MILKIWSLDGLTTTVSTKQPLMMFRFLLCCMVFYYICSFQLLGRALLLLYYTLILNALFCLPCKIGRSVVSLFLHSPLADFIFFFLSLLPNLMHVLLKLYWFSGGSHSGFLFWLLLFFCCFLENKYPKG